MDSIALYSIKGGVGKTASAVNLAALSAIHGRRTLLWDLDPQGATSWYLEAEPVRDPGLKRLFKGKGLKGLVRKTAYRNLEVLPAGPAYRDMDLALHDMKRSRKRMAEVVEKLGKHYDTLVIDAPPGLSLVSDNIFRAADTLLVPLIPTWLSARSYHQLLEHLAAQGIPTHRVQAFLTMVDRRRRVHQRFREELGRDINALLPVDVPYASLVERMGEDGRPLVYSHPRSAPAQAYAALWRSLDERMLP